jgi:hypothetical protein
VQYTVIRDTQEQQGWDFIPGPSCLGTIKQKLPTGDYTLVGYEDIFTIERKGSTGELAKNIYEGRFERELQRMEGFAHPFMVVEFTMEDILSFPKNSGIPIRLWPKLKTTSFFLLKRFIEFQVQYKTHIILAGKQAKEVASSIFKRIVEENE